MHSLDMLASNVERRKPLPLSKWQQWLFTSVGVVLAGLPFTPLAHAKEELLIHLLNAAPELAVMAECAMLVVSVMLIRFLFVNVLSSRRFHKPMSGSIAKPSGSFGNGSKELKEQQQQQ
jgi:uncharacterized membrane protein